MRAISSFFYLEFVRKYKKNISYSIWAIFLVLVFKGITNNLLIFFIVLAQFSLNIICGDFKFKEVKNKSKGNFFDSSEGGTGWSGFGDGDCVGGDGGGGGVCGD